MPRDSRAVNRRTTLKIVGGASALGLTGLAGCLGDDDDPADDDSDAAPGTGDDTDDSDDTGPENGDDLEDHLTIYTATNIDPIARAFEDHSGVTVDDSVYTGPQAAGRFQSEAEAGEFNADILITSAGFLTFEGTIDHLIEFDMPNGENLMDDRLENRLEEVGILGIGWPIARFIRGTPYSTQRVSDPPVTHDDFLDDTWEERLATPGFNLDRAYTLLLESGWSEDEAQEYILDLDDNIAEYTASATGTPDDILAGSYDVGVQIMAFFPGGPIQDGAPLDLTFPETAGGHAFAAAISGPADSTNAARAFMEFVGSDEGQEVVQQDMGFDPAHLDMAHGTPAVEEALEAYDPEVIDLVYTAEWATESRELMNELVGI